MPNYPQRKSPRLANYDYTQNGAYFITICTAGRNSLFGQIENGIMQLNELGNLAQTCWFDIPLHRMNVELGAFVVMPNHIHGIVVLHVETPKVQRTGQVPSIQAGSLGTIVGAYKASVTRQARRAEFFADDVLWQERYHDHIIRDTHSYEQITAYVESNPQRWEDDTFYL